MINLKHIYERGRTLPPAERYTLYTDAIAEYHKPEETYDLAEIMEEAEMIDSFTDKQMSEYCDDAAKHHEEQEVYAQLLREEADALFISFNGSKPRRALPSMRLSELAAQLTRLNEGKHKPQSIKVKAEAIQNFINVKGDMLLADITALHCAEFFREKLKTVRRVTHNSLLKELKAAFNQAIDLGFTVENPFNSIQKCSISDDGKPKHLTPEQLQAVLDAVPSHLSEYADIITVLAHTGMRRGELLALQWEDFDEEAGTIIIRRTKNGTSRTLPLTEAACAIIKNMRGGSACEYIFDCEGRRRDDRHVSKMIKKFFIAAGLPGNLHLHSLRHTAGTWMHKNGVSILDISRTLGHKNSAITEQYYVETDGETMKRAMRPLGKLPSSGDRAITSCNLFPISGMLPLQNEGRNADAA